MRALRSLDLQPEQQKKVRELFGALREQSREARDPEARRALAAKLYEQVVGNPEKGQKGVLTPEQVEKLKQWKPEAPPRRDRRGGRGGRAGGPGGGEARPGR